jgi:hypothetical protein
MEGRGAGRGGGSRRGEAGEREEHNGKPIMNSNNMVLREYVAFPVPP